MSLECSECERDLRAGHDPSCSRYEVCQCGHGRGVHDEEWPGVCDARGCRCTAFQAASSGEKGNDL